MKDRPAQETIDQIKADIEEEMRMTPIWEALEEEHENGEHRNDAVWGCHACDREAGER